MSTADPADELRQLYPPLLTTAHVAEMMHCTIGDVRDKVHRGRVTLGKALGDAVRKGLLYRNPVELADRPKAQKRDATAIVWTPEEVGVFMVGDW